MYDFRFITYLSFVSRFVTSFVHFVGTNNYLLRVVALVRRGVFVRDF